MKIIFNVQPVYGEPFISEELDHPAVPRIGERLIWDGKIS